MSRLRIVLFVVVGGGVAGLLHMLAAGTWGRDAEYIVARRGANQIGGTDLVVSLHVYTRIGEQRDHFEVPRPAFDAAMPDDILHATVRRVPIVNGELFEYTLARDGQVVHRWTEGGPFYFTALALGGVAAGVVVTLLLMILATVFKLKAAQDG